MDTEQTAVPEGLTPDEQFFYRYAGWSYHPGTETSEQGRLRGAKALARAEQYAKDCALWYVWESDPDADDSFVDTWGPINARELWDAEEHTCEQVCLMRAPRPTDATQQPVVVASLGGIWDAKPEYRRVVEAELAAQAVIDD